MLDVIQSLWRFLCGFVPGGFTLFLVLLAIVLFIITNIYRHSGIMSTDRFRMLVISTVLLFVACYSAIWLITLPRRDVTVIACLPALPDPADKTAGQLVDQEQQLLPLNLQLLFPATGGRLHWQDCRHLVCFAEPDSMRDLERVCELLDADYLIQPQVDSTGLELYVYRVRWHHPKLLAHFPVCACDPHEAGVQLQTALAGELALPDPVATDSWLAEDLSVICVSDTAAVVAALLQQSELVPILKEQLARLLLVSEREQQAGTIVKLLRQLALEDSTSLTLQLLYARWYAGLEEWDNVELALSNALVLDPLSAEARYLVSFLLPERRARLGAGSREELLRQLADSEPAWQPGRLLWISWLEDHGHLQQALSEAKELAYLLPGSYYASFRLAMMAFRTQNYELADETYTRLTGMYPTRPDPYYNLGINKFMIREFKQGIAAFQRVLEIGGDQNAHLYLAKCYAWLGNRERAIFHLRQRLLFRSEGDEIQIDETLKELSLYFPERWQPDGGEE